jgi:diguanylate cyclase (GGDEF)-like protein
VRSGQDFVVNDVTTDYRCPHQEVNQAEGSYMCAPISTGGAVLGWIHLVSLQKNFFTAERCFMINSYISTIAPSISNMRLLKAHRNMAMRDSLTGLYNRRFLEESISAQVPFAARYSQPLSLMMIDIDHFKRFNDLYGHKQGDEIMQKVSNVLTDTARDSDIVSRYGGEEFVIIMPNTTKEGGIRLAEKIRLAIEAKTMLNMNGTQEVTTVSIGLSTYPDDAADITELMRQVDIALYKSKANGRNIVTATSASPDKNEPGKKAS